MTNATPDCGKVACMSRTKPPSVPQGCTTELWQRMYAAWGWPLVCSVPARASRKERLAASLRTWPAALTMPPSPTATFLWCTLPQGCGRHSVADSRTSVERASSLAPRKPHGLPPYSDHTLPQDIRAGACHAACRDFQTTGKVSGHQPDRRGMADNIPSEWRESGVTGPSPSHLRACSRVPLGSTM